jgi:peptidoglycan/LPS O-acetylase OafA/YrhL
MWILSLKVKGYLLFVFFFFFADYNKRLKVLIGALALGEPSDVMCGMYVCTYVCAYSFIYSFIPRSFIFGSAGISLMEVDVRRKAKKVLHIMNISIKIRKRVEGNGCGQ